MIGRRRFLEALAALGVSQALPVRATDRKVAFDSYPFTLGVASGYPAPDGFVLWTRLAPRPLEPGGGLAPRPVPMRWEVAEDEKFARVVAGRAEFPGQEWAHSVHAQVSGLLPDRWYFYRFLAGDAVSPIGRTRTAPAASAAVSRLRFAFASCQHYEQGWFTAHRHLARDDLDLVAFLGDYIYESSWGREHVRKHEAGVPATLEEYRARHALYKTDADLQRAHAAFPWIVTWDDHEVINDYAGEHPGYESPSQAFLARRTAAYRAFYEHMPLPAAMRPRGTEMRIYTHLDWGSLARICVLDNRQYRSLQPCREPGPRGAPMVDPEKCTVLGDPSRSLLGGAQEAWLERSLGESTAGWNILAQQTLMAQMDRKPGEGRVFWTDGWDGYPASRRKLLSFLNEKRIANPVVIGGDVHMHFVADLKPDFDDPKSPVVASEFCGTSITSQGAAQKQVDERLPDNPHIKYGRSDQRGYVRMSIAGGRLGAELIGLDSVKRPDSRADVLARFAVESGKPGPQRA
jgi:alkaline phosphatase D